jgi:hypothetical protein
MELRDLQHFQHEHDMKFHSQLMSWEREKQLEHCTLHLAKLSGLFSAYCEQTQLGESIDATRLFAERIPDILVFALKMANLTNLDLETAYMTRIREVEGRR